METTKIIFNIVFTENDDSKLSTEKVTILEQEYTGVNSEKKIGMLLDRWQPGADFVLISDQASVLWLLNIRGRDTKYTPFVFGFLLVSKNGKVEFYTEHELRKDFLPSIFVRREREFSQRNFGSKFIAVEKSTLRISLHEMILRNGGECIALPYDIVAYLRSIKNSVEIKRLKEAHITDGIALCEIFYWLDKNLDSGKLDEYVISQKLDEARLKRGAVSPSFGSIVAYNENGAMIHYMAKRNRAKVSRKGTIWECSVCIEQRKL